MHAIGTMHYNCKSSINFACFSLDFEEELNKEVLAFNLNDTIGNLTEFQNNLQAAGGMMSLETEVEQLINQLLGLLTDQIPTIINQVVSNTIK